MIIGDPSRFALEYEITHAYARLSLRALGYFAIHVGGRCYGVRSWDATMLAAAFEGVAKRIVMRGSHKAPTISMAESEAIARSFSRAIYVEHEKDELFFGMRDSDFTTSLYSNDLVWAPDGDEGFDDGSCVLQFDIEDKVRLIAFSRDTNSILDPESLREISIPSEDFYAILQNWHDRFLEEWASFPKEFTPYLH